MNKKAQVWILDFIIGFLFFTTALIVFFKYTPNLYLKTDTGDLLNEAKMLSDKFMSSGMPENWEELNLNNEENMSRVSYFGITNDNFRINNSKLNRIMNITNTSYDEVRIKQGLKYDFFVELTQRGNVKVSFGHDFEPEYNKIKNLVKVERIVILNSTVSKLKIIVFEE